MIRFASPTRARLRDQAKPRPIDVYLIRSTNRPKPSIWLESQSINPKSYFYWSIFALLLKHCFLPLHLQPLLRHKRCTRVRAESEYAFGLHLHKHKCPPPQIKHNPQSSPLSSQTLVASYRSPDTRLPPTAPASSICCCFSVSTCNRWRAMLSASALSVRSSTLPLCVKRAFGGSSGRRDCSVMVHEKTRAAFPHRRWHRWTQTNYALGGLVGQEERFR